MRYKIQVSVIEIPEEGDGVYIFEFASEQERLEAVMSMGIAVSKLFASEHHIPLLTMKDDLR